MRLVRRVLIEKRKSCISISKVANLAGKTYSQLTEYQYNYVPFCSSAGLLFLAFQKNNPISNPKVLQIGLFWYSVQGKKNAQNVGFEHFGTLWYCTYAEKMGFEPTTS